MPGRLHIRRIVRRVLPACPVGKFDKRQTAAVIHLCGKHKADFFHRHLRRQMDHTLNILHRISVSVPVAKTAISKGSRPRPDKSHKTVVSIPCIDHGIKLRAWRFDLKVGKFFMPISNQLLPFLPTGFLRPLITLQNLSGLSVFLHAKNKCYMFRLSRRQSNPGGKSSAAVFIVIEFSSEIPGRHTDRIIVSMIPS